MNWNITYRKAGRYPGAFIVRGALVLLLLAFCMTLRTSQAQAEETDQAEKPDRKQYGILVADAKDGYTFYDFNDGSEGKAAIEGTEAGIIMLPLEELAEKIPGLTVQYDRKKRTATVTNNNKGKKIIYTKGSNKLRYYASSKAKAEKKSMENEMYLSEDSGAVMVPMQSLKWVMGSPKGFAYYSDSQLQGKGYDLSTYSGLLQFNSFQAITSLPDAPKVYGISSIIRVTIPEGYSVSQSFDLLVKKGVCASTQELYDAMENFNFDVGRYPLYAAIEEKEERCFKLEGYLFPDTYDFYLLSKPQDVIGKFLRNLEAKITQADRQKAEVLGYRMDQILTIASLIEKETSGHERMADIASVIYNRLNIGMKLQLDCSIYYVERYIKPYINGDINRYNAYYNTYKCSALPAGPICNPGRAAIQAALHPSITEYLYFYSDKAGEYHFSKEYVDPKVQEQN